MDVSLFYKNRINKLIELENHYIKKGKIFPVTRLLSIVFAFSFFYWFYNYNILFSWISLLVFFSVFVIIARKDLKNGEKLTLLNLYKSINENELNCLNGSFEFYYNGKDYIDNNHAYSYDLDIFGDYSIFQYINRTTLKISCDILANWLQNPASKNEIKLRQEAVCELRDKIDWRQNLYALGLKHKHSKKSPDSLLKWMKEPFDIQNIRKIFIACGFIFSITVISTILSVLSLIPIIIPVVFILIHYVIIRKTNNKIKIIHDKVSKNVDLLETYSDIIALIKKEKFNSVKLNNLCQIFNTDKNILNNIKQLSGILNKLDFRFNVLIHPVINVLFFFDIIQTYRLYKWKRKNSNNIEKLFYTIGEFEALSSFANLSHNNPKWHFPDISSEHFIFKAKNIGHPLISEDKRVLNDFKIIGDSKIAIITGSNMSGKSTFLRTIGVNIVLSMAGSCVCAEKLALSHVKVVSSMRISDSLKENTSTFHAELKKIGNIVRLVENKEKVFLLLDEILKGTNTNDKYLGSVALIKQFIKNNAVGIMATHDIPLAKLHDDMPDNIENYHFDVQVNNNELFFDYKLYRGICKSLNASILMKKIGIKI